jgi:hypothetical protein
MTTTVRGKLKGVDSEVRSRRLEGRVGTGPEVGRLEERCDLALSHPIVPYSFCLTFLWQVGHNRKVGAFPCSSSQLNNKNPSKNPSKPRAGWADAERYHV